MMIAGWTFCEAFSVSKDYLMLLEIKWQKHKFLIKNYNLQQQNIEFAFHSLNFVLIFRNLLTFPLRKE